MPTRETVEQFVNKDRFRALVDRVGIPRPRSIPLSGPEDLDQIADVKLQERVLQADRLPAREFGKKGSFVKPHEAAVRLLERARAAGITFLFQEWIPGNMAATVLIEGFVDRNGRMRAWWRDGDSA